MGSTESLLYTRTRSQELRYNVLKGYKFGRETFDRWERDNSSGLGNLAVPQPSCFPRVAWQLGTERVLQLNSWSLDTAIISDDRQSKRAFRSRKTTIVNIVIIGSMTSVFNTDASLPHNHDLFESLIVKKRIKKLKTRSLLTSVDSHILQCLQPGAVRITRSPSWKAASIDTTQTFRDFCYTFCPGQGFTTALHPPL
ncbi:hypothetical protein CSKR_106116 [Clonorchis sinensis]|uniref:Uncharacterized protein n=1 Tax=Clonorchis sinensis TaxID=79923 RepID=A0A419QEE3_CLOSI|nr:hypothetical protein CSKR_106116 [Clonorchis sinensis]